MDILCSEIGGLISLSPVVGEMGFGRGVELICFFRSCRALISRAFSGVMVGVFRAIVFGDIRGFIEVPELVVGRPPLV